MKRTKGREFNCTKIAHKSNDDVEKKIQNVFISTTKKVLYSDQILIHLIKFD